MGNRFKNRVRAAQAVKSVKQQVKNVAEYMNGANLELSSQVRQTMVIQAAMIEHFNCHGEIQAIIAAKMAEQSKAKKEAEAKAEAMTAEAKEE